MPEVAVPWGEAELPIHLPEHWTLQQVAESNLPAAGDHWPDQLAMALNQTGRDPSLAERLHSCRRGRIVLVLEDITRNSPLPRILDVVMREIHHAGIEDSQVEAVFATGMHAPMSAEQASAKLGPLAEAIRWRCNPWDDPSAYACLGKVGRVEVWLDKGIVEADLRIIITSVSPHLQAGFGGGYKMLLPGCASLATIRGLHRLGVGRRLRQWVGTAASENPMRRAIDAGGRLVESAGRGEKTFGVQYLLDDANRPAHLATGDVLAGQQMLAKRCAVACGVLTGPPADVVVVNAYPRDFDLWQGFKCIANTLWSVRPGGAIICLARCEAGLAEMPVPPWPLSPTWTRRVVRAIGPEALASLTRRLLPRLAGDAAFFIRMALQTLYRNPIYMVSPALCRPGRRFPGLELFATPKEAIKVVDDSFGGGNQRVIVFPTGGMTYPAIPPGRVE